MLKSILTAFNINLTSSGNHYQQQARQQNCNLIESNGRWMLYKDGVLISNDKTPWDAIMPLVK